MMAIPPSEAKRLTWQEYEGLLWTWNDRHKLEEEVAEAPDPDFVAKRMQRLADKGLARTIH